ncbi:MAG: N(4)-(beta-N-acetylglucosaminyl)-L-asparaginase [Thermomicrobiales bacterium]
MSKSGQGILVASSNAAVGFAAGMEILRTGGSAMDAVVATIALVEANPDDHSVGYSGLPNLLGEVELDASIMDGRTLAAGSVGALHGHQDAIAVARKVMDELPHVLIVGAGADRFADETGFLATNLLTPESERVWRERLDQAPLGHDNYMERVRTLVAALSRDPEMPDEVHGTVNVIARDRAGTIVCGVSTSGWAWKYPGRLGDSPIIGAGNYADNPYGAAACTGRGEMAERLCTAHTVVTAMRFGRSLDDALTLAANDLIALEDAYRSEVNIVAMDRDGRPGAVTTTEGKTFIVQDESMSEPDERPRRYIPE